MGNKLATQGISTQSDYYFHDLDKAPVFEQSLGNGRFLRTTQCRNEEGKVVIKVYLKRPPYTEDLKEYSDKLKLIRDKIKSNNCKNLMGIRKIVETDKAGYLYRQYFINNLHSRMGTRPFLSDIEKMWISYQLIKALHECSRSGIVHGDLKLENVMVTSWNWIYLTDFACYKPTYLSEDSPSDFSFFFDTSGRRTCYVAPERFISTSNTPQGTSANVNTINSDDLTHQMDIFSLGCVIAELFLDGAPRTIFTLSQLLSYRKGEYDPTPIIDRIKCEPAKLLIKKMIKRDPSERNIASYYLSTWVEMGFPNYFEDLHKLIYNLMQTEPEKKIISIKNDFGNIIFMFSGSVNINMGNETFNSCNISNLENKLNKNAENLIINPIENENENDKDFLASKYEELYYYQQEERKKTQKILGKIAEIPVGIDREYEKEYLEYSNYLIPDANQLSEECENFMINLETSFESAMKNFDKKLKNHLLPPSQQANEKVKKIEKNKIIKNNENVGKLEGLEVILSLICSCFHLIENRMVKIEGIELLIAFSYFLSDDCKLQRIVPYLVSKLEDSSAIVRAFTVNALTIVLDLLKVYPPSDIDLFPEYIMPVLINLSNDREVIVKEALARNMGKLAEIAKKFLESSQIYIYERDWSAIQLNLRQADNSSLSTNGNAAKLSWKLQKQTYSNYDLRLSELRELFNTILSMFYKDCPSIVKRALLIDITRLAVFFGRQKTVEFILPLIVTFLNETDWELRHEFFENILGICEFIGCTSLESFMYPCMLQGLNDREDIVVSKSIICLYSLCEKNLFKKATLFDIIKKTQSLLLHPNEWIRFGIVKLIHTIAKFTSQIDLLFVIDMIQPYFESTLSFESLLDIDYLLAHLLPPISRELLMKAIILCSKLLHNWVNEASTPHIAAKANPTTVEGQLKHYSIPASSKFPYFIKSTVNPQSFDVASSKDNKSSKKHDFSFIISPYDPDDIFIINFKKTLFEHSITDAERDVILLMVNYIKDKTKNIEIRRTKVSHDLDEDLAGFDIIEHLDDDEEQLKEYKNFSKNLPCPGAYYGNDRLYGTGSGLSLTTSIIASAIQGNNQATASPSSDSPMLTREGGSGNANLQLGTVSRENLSIPQSLAERSSSLLSSSGSGSIPQQIYIHCVHLPVIGEKLTDERINSDIELKYFFGLSLKHLSGYHNSQGSSLVPSITSPDPKYTLPPLQNFGKIKKFPPPGTAGAVPLPVRCENLRSWKPQGVLIAQLTEHKMAVNQLRITSDNAFFVSGSDDGTIRVWDCQKLEKKVTTRARLMFDQSASGGKIKSLALLEHSHTVACGTELNKISLYRIDSEDKKEGIEYKGATQMDQYGTRGSVCVLEHYSHQFQSLLVAGMSNGLITAFDIRLQKEAFHLVESSSRGSITSMIVDPGHNYIISSTNRGCYTLWDVRFNLPVKSWWQLDDKDHNCIHKLAKAHNKPSTSFYSSVGNGKVYLYDIENDICKKMWQILDVNDHISNIFPTNASLFRSSSPHPKQRTSSFKLNRPETHAQRALLTIPHSAHFFTGGADRPIRFWDSVNISNCYRFPVSSSFPEPRYRTEKHEDLEIFQEIPQKPPAPVLPKPPLAPCTPLPDFHHQDTITDIIAGEIPLNMLISSSRDGIIKVWK